MSALSIQIDDGRVPENALLEISRACKRVNIPKVDGTLPVKLFPPRDTDVSPYRYPRDVGMEPTRAGEDEVKSNPVMTSSVQETPVALPPHKKPMDANSQD